MVLLKMHVCAPGKLMAAALVNVNHCIDNCGCLHVFLTPRNVKNVEKHNALRATVLLHGGC
jgi:sulfite exporter TauE/SafE